MILSAKLPLKYRLQDFVLSAAARCTTHFELSIRSGGCGFFGDVAMALNGLRFAENNNAQCAVHWGRQSLYFDEKHGANVWDYYFKESAFSFSGKPSRSRQLAVSYRPSAKEYERYEGLNYRHSVARALDRFCQPKDHVQELLSSYQHECFSTHGNLGIHVRMTDAAMGYENRNAGQIENYIFEVESWVKKNPRGKIFLATDDNKTISLFESRYGAKVHYRSCLRSDDNTSIHGHYDGGVSGSAYQKGLDVLVDALLLSRCDQLIRCHSRVTWYSLCANPDLYFVDTDAKYHNKYLMPEIFE
jgi:hypothetical protein